MPLKSIGAIALLFLVGSSAWATSQKTIITGTPPFLLGASQADVLRGAPSLQPNPPSQRGTYLGQFTIPIGGVTYPATVSVQFKQGLLTLAIIAWTFGEKETIAKAIALRQEILGIYAPALVVTDALKDGSPSSGALLRLRDVQGNELVMTPTALGQLMLLFTAGSAKLPGGS